MQQFPKFRGQRFIREFVGREQGLSRALKFVDWTLPTFRLFAGGDRKNILEIFWLADFGIDCLQA